MKQETLPEEMKLEDALKRLEAIAAEMEDDSVDLAGSLARYREARALYTSCVSRLGQAEREVEILMADGDTEAAGDLGSTREDLE